VASCSRPNVEPLEYNEAEFGEHLETSLRPASPRLADNRHVLIIADLSRTFPFHSESVYKQRKAHCSLPARVCNGPHWSPIQSSDLDVISCMAKQDRTKYQRSAFHSSPPSRMYRRRAYRGKDPFVRSWHEYRSTNLGPSKYVKIPQAGSRRNRCKGTDQGQPPPH